MPSVLRISEAASLGLHAMLLMAQTPDVPVSCRSIAAAFRVSQAHLAELLQRIERQGLVSSVRGAQGGFMLARPAHRIALLDIYEALEGPIAANDCLFQDPSCHRRECVFAELLQPISKQFVTYMRRTKLSDVSARPKARDRGDGAPRRKVRAK